jgi:hypothetical protein
MSCCDDYCCNYGCNQGRNCPARACAKCYGTGYDASGYDCACGAKPAKVARVGKRMPDREPLRGAAWRVYLKDLARSMLLCLGVVAVSAVVVALMTWGLR